MKTFCRYRGWLLAALLVLPFTITNDSLWLDEGDTAVKYVAQPDLPAWWAAIHHDGGSDSEMPLGDFCFWAASRVLGTAEWQLRSLNILWGTLALIAVALAARRLQLAWLPLLFVLQPFFWFYLDQARPYALQTALGAWLFFAFVEFITAKAGGTAWAWTLAVAGFVLFCATMLAPLSIFAIVLAGAWAAWRRGWKPARKAVLILLGGALACVPVGLYYVSALMRGAKGSQVWSVDWKAFGYVAYELTGQLGLGLPADEIRTLARSPHFAGVVLAHFGQFFLPLLGAALLITVLFLGLKRRRLADDSGLADGLILVLVVATVEFFAVSLVLEKAFWARHYAPVFAFYVALIGLAAVSLWRSTRMWQRVLPVALCGLLLLSALNLRFAPQWRKEDYRAAARFGNAALAEGKSVWWLAGGYPATYYGLPFSFYQPEPGKAFIAFSTRTNLATLPLPDVVIINKPDIHDPGSAVGKLIGESGYRVGARYQNFTVWLKPASLPANP